MEKEWLLREKYGGKLTAAAKRDLKRLAGGEHINYIIGWAPFLGCRIDLSEKPLIPRPETEYWTEKTVTEIRKSGIAAPKVLDLFCGSGCIGIAVLKHIPQARVDFADIENKYFKDIRKSLRANKIAASRARCIRSDVFKNIPRKKYDFILANPPYIPSSGRKVAKSVLSQEPQRALFAGQDGMIYIKRLLRQASRHLKPHGLLIFEFGSGQKQAIAAEARVAGWDAKFFKDHYGRWRFAALRQK